MRRHPAVLTLLLFAGLMVGAGPCVMFPGGELDGAATPVPSDWSVSEEVNTIQLETRPEEPYSVNIWTAGVGPYLYVHAGANRSAWVEHIEEDARVRVRIEGNVYALQAVRVDEQEEFDRFSDAYEGKYGIRPRNEKVGEAYLYRLGAR